jgi:hypothetical protein
MTERVVTLLDWLENPGLVKDYRDNPMHPECHGIEPEEFWVVSNLYPVRGYPMKVQGFLGAYAGRPNDYWCPAVQFTTSEPYIYRTAADAIICALDRVEKDQKEINDRLEYIRKALDLHG